MCVGLCIFKYKIYHQHFQHGSAKNVYIYNKIFVTSIYLAVFNENWDSISYLLDLKTLGFQYGKKN